MWLTVENEKVDVSFILDFIENSLSNIIHHRNMLSNFQLVYPGVSETLSSVEISIDFLENLTLFLPEKIDSKKCWGRLIGHL